MSVPNNRRLVALQLCATNDRNGNPRRCLLVVEAGPMPHKVAAVDEGYEGESGSLKLAGFDGVGILAHRLEVPVRQYRAALRDLPNTREDAERRYEELGL
jgi:hypothetical protein